MQGVYKITNTITGEFYIGQSNNVERRWMEHKTPKNTINSNNKLDNAIGEYGASCFVLEVIEEVSLKKDLLEREKFWIKKLNPVYNKVHTDSYHLDENVRKHLSECAKKQWENTSNDKKQYILANCLIGPRKGHKVSGATREKLRIANLGKVKSIETRMKLSRANKITSLGNQRGNKRIVALFDDGFPIMLFPSVKSAGQFLRLPPGRITAVLKHRRKHCRGYVWRYYKDWSVETIGDECSQVGASLPRIEVRDNQTVEEIVHPYKMVNYEINDKGFIQLAIRSGQFKTLNATDVREGEMQERDFLTGEIKFKWDNTSDRLNKAIVGYVAFFELTNGFKQTLFMTVEELKAHATKYSQTYSSKNEYVRNSSKWTTDFEAMAKKTVIKLLLSRYAPLSVDMQTAMKADQSVQRNAGEYTYSDNPENAKSKLTELVQDEMLPTDDEVIDVEEVKQNEANQD